MELADLRPEAASAARAVRSALDVISARVDGDQVTSKGGSDIVTGTDLTSQEAIRAILDTEHPEHGFVGEESGADIRSPQDSYWLVDPICGTRNFASRIPLYAVNIALVENGQLVVAAVGDGGSGDLWIAERGRGAWSESSGTLAPISVSAESTIVVLDPGRPGGPMAQVAATALSAAVRGAQWEIRILGTTLDLAYLADGRVAGVKHFSRIPPLHVAAGALLATEAGALVTDDRGAPWTVESIGLVAAATPELHAQILALNYNTATNVGFPGALP